MKKRVSILTLVLTLAFCLTACGGSAYDNAASAPAMKNEAVTEEFYDAEMGFSGGTGSVEVTEEASGSQSVNQTERKLIKTVDMSVETKEFDTMLAAVENKVNALNGYIENMETYNGSAYSSYRDSRSASITVRVPQESLNAFLEEVSAISNVVRHSENVEDVTLQYVDLSSHKEVLLAEQERLLELIEEANSIEDIITLESRLSEIRYQIESMESQLRTYDNKVTYSTVYLYIDEVQELTPVEEETVWQRISGGFVESLEDIADDATELFIWFVVNIPYLCIWAFVIIVVVLVLKKRTAKILREKEQSKKSNALAKENEGQGINE